MSEEKEKKIYRGRIKVPYKHTAGDYVERFMEAIGKEDKIMGVKCPKCGKVYVPPKMVCFECFEKMEEWTEVGKQGTVEGFTIINHSTDVMPLKPPFGYGIILLDGADTGFVHIINESDLEKFKKGMRVEAVFKDRRQKKITDIEYFKLI
jgi:hypothetical protein